jgi:hypothetical protein
MRDHFCPKYWFGVVLSLFVSTAVMLGSSSVQAATGPDVTVFNLSDTSNYGTNGGIRGYAVGTVSCNIGDQPLNWCNNVGGCGLGTTGNDHPVIAQNMYRLKNGRFDQVGASWLKHGFTSTNSFNTECGATCTAPPLGGDQLGVGCTDPYGSGLNGARPLGRKSEVNATTGAYPFPFGGGGSSSFFWNQRLAVAEADMIAAQNPSARYFVEGHYIAPDDAGWGNGLNNASYREVSVAATTFNLTFIGTTQRRKSAIEAWQVIDPTVEIFNVDTPTTPVQRFHVARKVTEVTPGVLWHYEYAVHNMNSDRSTDRLTVQFFGSTTFTNAGFHDVDAHSGEPFDTADWPSTTTSDSIYWQAPAFATPQNANAIRWGTMYNFWFDSTRPPSEIALSELQLFTAGSPSTLQFDVNEVPVLFGNGYE